MIKKNCSLLALKLEVYGNYWGLQVDEDIRIDLNPLVLIIKIKSLNVLSRFLEDLLGKFKDYDNDFRINHYYENFINRRNKFEKGELIIG